MIVVMSISASNTEIADVVNRVQTMGHQAHLSQGQERAIVGVIGRWQPLDREQLAAMPGVQDVMPVSHPYKIAGRDFHPDDSLIPLNGIQVGGPDLAIIAGPCSVESRSQILETAHAVREAGATALRGGAFKPRSSPYSFQGLGEEALTYLAEAREATGLPIVTEVMDPQLVSLVGSYADVLQIGARNMQNYTLLHAVGQGRFPVLLKRGMSNTIEELLMAAEYILSHGNMQVFLCERGIRTFETATRNTFDINAIPVLKQATHLPVIADPSHGVGRWQHVAAVSLAAIAAGADGLLIEVHPRPEEALSDGPQSLQPERFAALVRQVAALAPVVGRRLGSARSIHAGPDEPAA